MKPKEIRSMAGSALDEKMIELKKELVKINAQIAIGTALKNPGQARKVKKTMARILTISNKKDENKDQGVDKKT